MLVFGALLMLAPVRWVLRRLVTAPGEGRAREATVGESLEVRCLAVGVNGKGGEKRALGKFRWRGGIYYMTGVLLAEAAMEILRGKGVVGKGRLGGRGGVLTPACLGMGLVERLREVEGMGVDCEILD